MFMLDSNHTNLYGSFRINIFKNVIKATQIIVKFFLCLLCSNQRYDGNVKLSMKYKNLYHLTNACLLFVKIRNFQSLH